VPGVEAGRTFKGKKLENVCLPRTSSTAKKVPDITHGTWGSVGGGGGNRLNLAGGSKVVGTLKRRNTMTLDAFLSNLKIKAPRW